MRHVLFSPTSHAGFERRLLPLSFKYSRLTRTPATPDDELHTFVVHKDEPNTCQVFSHLSLPSQLKTICGRRSADLLFFAAARQGVPPAFHYASGSAQRPVPRSSLYTGAGLTKVIQWMSELGSKQHGCEQNRNEPKGRGTSGKRKPVKGTLKSKPMLVEIHRLTSPKN